MKKADQRESQPPSSQPVKLPVVEYLPPPPPLPSETHTYMYIHVYTYNHDLFLDHSMYIHVFVYMYNLVFLCTFITHNVYQI